MVCNVFLAIDQSEAEVSHFWGIQIQIHYLHSKLLTYIAPPGKAYLGTFSVVALHRTMRQVRRVPWPDDTFGLRRPDHQDGSMCCCASYSPSMRAARDRNFAKMSFRMSNGEPLPEIEKDTSLNIPTLQVTKHQCMMDIDMAECAAPTHWLNPILSTLENKRLVLESLKRIRGESRRLTGTGICGYCRRVLKYNSISKAEHTAASNVPMLSAFSSLGICCRTCLKHILYLTASKWELQQSALLWDNMLFFPRCARSENQSTSIIGPLPAIMVNGMLGFLSEVRST